MMFDPQKPFDVEAEAKELRVAVNAPAFTKATTEATVADAYRFGFRDCLRLFGIWKDGEQTIGCMQKPIKDYISKLADAGIPIDEFSRDF
jgi:hypothetical protein